MFKIQYTDEDLQLLKICMDRDPQQITTFVSTNSLKALLSRLRFAEKLVRFGRHTYDCATADYLNKCDCGFDRAYDAWVESADKRE